MKIASLYFCLVLFPFALLSQSTVFLKSGKKLDVTGFNIDKKQISFQLADSNVTYMLPVGQVYKTIDGDGASTMYAIPRKNYSKHYLTHFLDSTDQYQLGQYAAQMNYHGNRSAGLATGIVSFLTVLAPYATVTLLTVYSTGKPKVENLNIPEEFISDEAYVEGYRNKARNKRAKSAWIGFGIGTTAFTGILVAVLAGSNSSVNIE